MTPGEEHPWAKAWMIGFGIALFAGVGASQWMLKVFFIRIGLMTEEEGRYFYRKRTPLEWTEEIDEHELPPEGHSDERADNVG